MTQRIKFWTCATVAAAASMCLSYYTGNCKEKMLRERIVAETKATAAHDDAWMLPTHSLEPNDKTISLNESVATDYVNGSWRYRPEEYLYVDGLGWLWLRADKAGCDYKGCESYKKRNGFVRIACAIPNANCIEPKVEPKDGGQ